MMWAQMKVENNAGKQQQQREEPGFPEQQPLRPDISAFTLTMLWA